MRGLARSLLNDERTAIVAAVVVDLGFDGAVDMSASFVDDVDKSSYR